MNKKDISCLVDITDEDTKFLKILCEKIKDRIDIEDRDERFKPTFSIKEIIIAISFVLTNFNEKPLFTFLKFKDIESNKLLTEVLILGAGIYLDGGSDMDRIMKSEKYSKLFERYQNIVKYVKANFLELVDLNQKMEELNLEIYGAN